MSWLFDLGISMSWFFSLGILISWLFVLWKNALESRYRGLFVSVSRCPSVLVPESQCRGFLVLKSRYDGFLVFESRCRDFLVLESRCPGFLVLESWCCVFLSWWSPDVIVYVPPRPRFRYHRESKRITHNLCQLCSWKIFQLSKLMQHLFCIMCMSELE